jgi:hypothetical protein
MTAEQINTIISNLTEQVIAITAAKKPSYADKDGLSVSWTQHLAELQKQLEYWQAQKAALLNRASLRFRQFNMTLGDSNDCH